MANGSDPLEWLTKISETARRVRLAPGVVGKSSYISVGVAVVWVIVLWRVSENYIQDALLFGGALFFTWYAQRETRKMREFAIANPALALMEGADITEYEKFVAQAKGQPALVDSVHISDPSQPLIPGTLNQGAEDG